MNSPKRALRYPQLKTEKGVPFTRQYLGRLEKADKFPHHIRLGGNTVAWLEHEIDQWLDERARSRGSGDET
jgi:prophage regulatory protein